LKKEESTTFNNMKSICSDFKKLVESQVQKEAFQEALALGKYYRIIGDTEKMLENKKVLQKLVKEHRTRRETPTVTPTPTLESVPVPEPVPLVIEVAKDNSSLLSVATVLYSQSRYCQM
jgi:hypothetical protein